MRAWIAGLAIVAACRKEGPTAPDYPLVGPIAR